MTDTIVPTQVVDAPARARVSNDLLTRLSRNAVLKRLATLTEGRLTLIEPNAQHVFGDSRSTLVSCVRVLDQRFYRHVAFGGALGVADAYIRRLWTTDDLTSLLRIFVRDLQASDSFERGLSRLTAPLRRIVHALHRNTRSGSAKNIRAHYDLSNEFFALFLDDTLTYSCGYFDSPGTSLREASVAKLDRICQRLELQPHHHLLEIGTGWGSFALHAARRYGCRVTTTTISREQHDLARQRIDEAGLSDRITVVLRDYRDLEGSFDRIASIEMIEAVGHEYLGTFFGSCSKLLCDDGVMVLQAITMPDQRYDQYRRSVDFIRHYVFPGSCVPSVQAMTNAVAKHTNLRVEGLDDIGLHYATTLRHWQQRFNRRLDDVRAMGFPESFIRLWHYYLCYCEAGFAERYISTVQMVLTKPRARRHAVSNPTNQS